MVATAERVTTVGYELWPKQMEAMQLLGLAPGRPVVDELFYGGSVASVPIEELLYGGQAGGGKSHLLRAIGVTLCAAWPGAVIPLFRRTFVELEDSHIRWIAQEIQPPVAEYEIGRRQLRFANGSLLQFRYAEEDNDVYRYNTAEWAGLLIDQCEALSEFQIRFLRHRVRQPKDVPYDWRPVIVYSANPGGISHQYLRRGFVDHGTPGVHVAPEDDGGFRRAYLPARLIDNPSLDAEAYRRNLRGLPADLVPAYLEGVWDIVPGAFFSHWRQTDVDGNPWHVWPEGFARERYNIPDEVAFPPPEWTHWAAVDGGWADPWCVLLAARAPDGRAFVYRELWGTRVTAEDQAKAIRKAVYNQLGTSGRLRLVLGDPNMFANRANLAVADEAIYRAQGVPMQRANNVRRIGWRRVSDLLASTLDDGYPRLVVVEGAAPNLVRTLPFLQRDRLDAEDVSDVHGRAPEDGIRDDAADTLRYLVTPATQPTNEGRRVDVEWERSGQERPRYGVGGSDVDGDDDPRWESQFGRYTGEGEIFNR